VEYHFLPAGAIAAENPACGRWDGECFRTESLPTLCVSVPAHFFDSPSVADVLQNKFRVSIGGKSAHGCWQSVSVAGSSREHFRWKWLDKEHPVMEKRSSSEQCYGSFSDLKGAFDIPDLCGKLIVSVESPELCRKWHIIKEPQRRGVNNTWKNLPGDFLPMVLLSQSKDGMDWSEMLTARNIISPGSRIDEGILYKYCNHEFLERRGAKWLMAKSKVAIIAGPSDNLLVDYCGDSGKLWGLYCHLSADFSHKLPAIEVVPGAAELPPFLQMSWPVDLRPKIESYFCGEGVEIGESLWIR
jgi:hypothetical protein